MSILALVLIQAVASLAGLVSNVSRMTVLCLWRIYEILDHIRISTSDSNNKVTSGLEGGIALYETFLHAGLHLPFHFFHSHLVRSVLSCPGPIDRKLFSNHLLLPGFLPLLWDCLGK